jgi:hypothetical protein
VVARGPERLLASDEGGELAAARQSAIHNCNMTGSQSPTAGARRGGSAAESVSRLDYSRIHVRL